MLDFRPRFSKNKVKVIHSSGIVPFLKAAGNFETEGTQLIILTERSLMLSQIPCPFAMALD